MKRITYCGLYSRVEEAKAPIFCCCQRSHLHRTYVCLNSSSRRRSTPLCPKFMLPKSKSRGPFFFFFFVNYILLFFVDYLFSTNILYRYVVRLRWKLLAKNLETIDYAYQIQFQVRREAYMHTSLLVDFFKFLFCRLFIKLAMFFHAFF